MPWPTDGTVLPTLTEFFINGAWDDQYSDRVRAAGRISITRGMADQQSSLSAQTSDFTLNSRDGLFSNRNPNSPLYGLFGQNTKVRHSVPLPGGGMDTYFLKLWQAGAANTWFSTADKAVLDITSDIDVRFEVTPVTWKPSIPVTVAGKWNGAQSSWLVTLMPTGLIRFIWCNAALTAFATQSSLGFANASGRYALRVTMDVDDGAGNRVIRFYWSSSLAGSWTLLSTTTTAGTTSIFNSTAALEIGGANGNGSSPFAGEIGWVGKIHGAEVYQGIAGTLRADFDPTVRAPGDTTWSDGLGTPNTWTLNGTNGRLTSDRIRFSGELSSIPQEWDETGLDVYLPVRASGALRRMMQGGQPIRSAIYRNLIRLSSIHGYWPMEADSGAIDPDRAVINTRSDAQNVTFTGSPPDGLRGSAGSVRLNSSTDSWVVLNSNTRASTGESTFLIYFKLETLPASERVLFAVQGSGTGSRVSVSVGPVSYALNVYNTADVLLNSQTALHGAGASPLNQWIGMQVTYATSGANTLFKVTWHAVGSDIFYTPSVPGTTFAGSTGHFTKVTLDARQDAAFAGAEFAHVVVTRDTQSLVSDEFRDSSKGYTGEPAGERMQRLAIEENLTMDMYGDPSLTEAMGAQLPGKVVDHFQDAAAVDGGVLAETRDEIALQYVTRRALDEQNPLTLDYGNSDLAATPKPIDDDRYLLNDVTASRPGGSSDRAVIEDGPRSVQEPPDGISRYAGTISKNAASDEQLGGLAGWETLWRTWDEPRVPNLVVGLHRPAFALDTFRTNALLDAGVGSRIDVTDLPSFLPPDDLRLLSFGYSEVIEQKLWTITYNTVPYGPYRTTRLDSGASVNDQARMAASITAPTVLAAAENTTDVSFVIDTPTGYPKWANSTAHASEFPFDINVGGERCTVTACTVGSTVGANWRQTLTVTRSVNGVVKSHLINATVDLWDISYLQLGA